MKSPSGKTIVPSEGPQTARIVFVGESPAANEIAKLRPFVGRAGKILDMGLSKAGIARSDVRLVNLVPVRAPGDKFVMHDSEDLMWGAQEFQKELERLNEGVVIIALGANPLKWLTGLGGAKNSINEWRGSVLPDELLRNVDLNPEKEDYVQLAPGMGGSRFVLPRGATIVPTYHPAYIARSFDDHPLFIADLQKAARVAKNGRPQLPKRKWFINQPEELQRLVTPVHVPPNHDGSCMYWDDQSAGACDCSRKGESVFGSTRLPVDMISIDTENYPYKIVGIATEDEVHVFELTDYDKTGGALETLLKSPQVLKIAHNLQHDWTFFKKELGFVPAGPWFDTGGGAHVLNPSMSMSLASIVSRFTDWPYHKWLVDVDPLWYNGMDAIGAYDAYWPMVERLSREGLWNVAVQDHKLLHPLLDMQHYGFRVNEGVRRSEEERLCELRETKKAALQLLVSPIVDANLSKFEKPHLFEIERKCPCCGGGALQREHCWTCSGGIGEGPNGKFDYHFNGLPCQLDKCTLKAHRSALSACAVCQGSGKVKRRVEFNPDSPDQVADVLYRGLKIRARKYKGKETIRVGQLEELGPKYPLVAALVEFARITADYDTLRRLRAGTDGRLHCVFDPFGTESGRVASREGLFEPGTNAMNIPKPSRKMIIPDEGFVFLYPDQKQVELRAMAVLSGDKRLLQLFNEADDVHIEIRNDFRQRGFAVSRDQTKRIEYASGYGARPEQLAKELTDEFYRKSAQGSEDAGIPLNAQQTAAIIETYFSLFPGLRGWQTKVEKELLETRKVRSLTGRVREFNGYVYDKKTKGVQYETLKKGWSFGPQDIGAWILGEGLLTLWNDRRLWELLRPLIHVHDALLLMTRIENIEEAKHEATKALSKEMWGMKFVASMKEGRNWYEAS
jgi:uracil-DNA glycosylase family 4